MHSRGVNFLVAFTALLCAEPLYCQESARLFQPASYPERLASRVCPFNIQAPTIENDDYIIRRFDDIELTVEEEAVLVTAPSPVASVIASRQFSLAFMDFAPETIRLPNAASAPEMSLHDLLRSVDREIELTRTSDNSKAMFSLRGTLVDINARPLHIGSASGARPLATDRLRISLRRTIKTAATAEYKTPMGHPGELELTKDLVCTRLPIMAFDKTDIAVDDVKRAYWTELRVVYGNASFKLALPLVEFGKTTWRNLKSAIERPSGNFHLRAKLLPRLEQFAVPGDRIRITRFEKDGADDGTGTGGYGEPRAWIYEIEVDSDGYISLPAITSTVAVSTSSGALDKDDTKSRRMSEVDAAFFRVRVWGVSQENRFPVQELGLAMSSRGSDYGWNRLKRTANSDKGGDVFPAMKPDTTELTFLRYHAQIDGCQFAIVCEGRTFTLPYRRGLLLNDAIRLSLTRIGPALAADSREYVDLTVVPDRDRNPSANPEAFVLPIRPGMQPNADMAVILPGDTIHVAFKKSK